MSNKIYDVLKYVAQIVLPAIATCYVTIAGLWGLPYPKEISGTVMAIDTLLGTVLMISSAQYNKKKEEK
jgi:hypothetical protein